MSKFLLLSAVRIATAGGEAHFLTADGQVQTNQIGRSWQNLEPGTVVELGAAFPGTHTFMVTLTPPAKEGEDAPAAKGAVLRKDAWDKLIGACAPCESQVESDSEIVAELAQVDAPAEDEVAELGDDDVADVSDEDEDEGPSDAELDALEDEF